MADGSIGVPAAMQTIRERVSRVHTGMNKDTLYYDGACPVCSAEIDKLGKLCGDGLELRNIHELAEDEDTPGRQALMSRLHLRTADGEWITGLQANIRAWQHTPLRFLWRLLELPLVNRVAERGYEWWLRRRNRADLSGEGGNSPRP